jgi:hypothetical protein
MIIVVSILTTLKASVVFRGGWAEGKNGLSLKSNHHKLAKIGETHCRYN